MYFDPGTGSMLIQILIGAIPVIGAFFIGLMRGVFKKKGTSDVSQGRVEEKPDTIIERKEDDGFEDIEDD